MSSILKRCIFITGFMASGKSTIGKLLASRLGIPFIDTDEIIEKNAGMTIREIFANMGESYFRKLESDLLRELARTCSRCARVIAAGGGMPCNGENLRLMRECGTIVYLETSIDDIISRIKNSSERPVYRRIEEYGNLRDGIEELLRKREQFYRQAHIIVENPNGQAPENTVSNIIQALPSKKSSIKGA
ncbi:MAG: shikimate kinase [Spirochaetota bacterium]